MRRAESMAGRTLPGDVICIAFSSEVETDSRQENASKISRRNQGAGLTVMVLVSVLVI